MQSFLCQNLLYWHSLTVGLSLFCAPLSSPLMMIWMDLYVTCDVPFPSLCYTGRCFSALKTGKQNGGEIESWVFLLCCGFEQCCFSHILPKSVYNCIASSFLKKISIFNKSQIEEISAENHFESHLYCTVLFKCAECFRFRGFFVRYLCFYSTFPLLN
jgi:hypothetical protein